jgi:F420-non-reducing hydrogenase iron-sulfur subunit
LGECHYRTGNYEAISKIHLITHIIKDLKINPNRLSLEWVSAAEGPRFVSLITRFTHRIKELGPLGSSESLDPEHLRVRLKAAKMALEGKRLRMIIARQAKYRKQGDTYRDIPPGHKLHMEFEKTLADESATSGILLYLQERARPVDELSKLLNLSTENVINYFKKLKKKRLIESDRLRVR